MVPIPTLVLDALVEIPSLALQLTERDINLLIGHFLQPSLQDQVTDLVVRLEPQVVAISGKYIPQDIAFEARCELFVEGGRLGIRLVEWQAGSGGPLMNSLLRLGKMVDRFTGLGRGWVLNALRAFAQEQPALEVRADETVLVDLGRMASDTLRAQAGLQLGGGSDLAIELTGLLCEAGRITTSIAVATPKATPLPRA
jgi:hypothetical protein